MIEALDLLLFNRITTVRLLDKGLAHTSISLVFFLALALDCSFVHVGNGQKHVLNKIS